MNQQLASFGVELGRPPARLKPSPLAGFPWVRGLTCTWMMRMPPRCWWWAWRRRGMRCCWWGEGRHHALCWLGAFWWSRCQQMRHRVVCGSPFEQNRGYRWLGLLTPNWGGGGRVGLRWAEIDKGWGVTQLFPSLVVSHSSLARHRRAWPQKVASCPSGKRYGGNSDRLG